MGSDFSYADMTERNLERYDYRLIKEDVLDGVPVWQVEAIPNTPKEIDETGYTKIRLRRAPGQRRDGARDLLAPEGRPHEVLRGEEARADRRHLGGDGDADGHAQGRRHAAQDRPAASTTCTSISRWTRAGSRCVSSKRASRRAGGRRGRDVGAAHRGGLAAARASGSRRPPRRATCRRSRTARSEPSRRATSTPARTATP